MVLKGPPNETQLGNAKRGPHHILLLKVEDVNISIELMGKGVLIQMDREPNGLVRVSRERYDKYKIVASYKAALGYFLGALIDEVLHWERSDKNDFALVLFEKSTRKNVQNARKEKQKGKKKKRFIKMIRKRKYSDDSLEWDLTDDEYNINDDKQSDCDESVEASADQECHKDGGGHENNDGAHEKGGSGHDHGGGNNDHGGNGHDHVGGVSGHDHGGGGSGHDHSGGGGGNNHGGGNHDHGGSGHDHGGDCGSGYCGGGGWGGGSSGWDGGGGDFGGGGGDGGC